MEMKYQIVLVYCNALSIKAAIKAKPGWCIMKVKKTQSVFTDKADNSHTNTPRETTASKWIIMSV